MRRSPPPLRRLRRTGVADKAMMKGAVGLDEVWAGAEATDSGVPVGGEVGAGVVEDEEGCR